MSSAEQFLRELTENEKIHGYIEAHPMEEGTDKMDGLLAVAKEFGFEFTKEELEKTLEERKAQIDEAKKDAASAELSLESLDGVTGGGDYPDCVDTHRARNEENCWFVDSCSMAVVCYYGTIA